MKKQMLLLLLPLIALLPLNANAMEKAGNHGHTEEKKMVMEDKTINGIKVYFHLMTREEHKEMMEKSGHKMTMEHDPNSTHHIMVSLYDTTERKMIDDSEVSVAVVAPDKQAFIKPLKTAMGHFGGNVTLAQKGSYSFLVKFVTSGKELEADFDVRM